MSFGLMSGCRTTARRLVVPLFAAVLCIPTSAHARVVTADGQSRATIDNDLAVTGDVTDPFIAAVKVCMDKFKKYPAKAGIIQALVAADPRTFFILRDGDDYGSYRGNVIRWNPTSTAKLGDGTQVDPCATLFHELVHAHQDLTNTFDDTPIDTGPTIDGRDATVPYSELAACQAENWFRKEEGLPQRTSYGMFFNGLFAPFVVTPKPIPDGIIFDRCADAACVDLTFFPEVPPVEPGQPPPPEPEPWTKTLDVSDFYFQVDIEGKPPLPGSEIPITGPDGKPKGTLKFIKDMQGRAWVKLTCAEGSKDALSAGRITWKLGGKKIDPPEIISVDCSEAKKCDESTAHPIPKPPASPPAPEGCGFDPGGETVAMVVDLGAALELTPGAVCTGARPLEVGGLVHPSPEVPPHPLANDHTTWVGAAPLAATWSEDQLDLLLGGGGPLGCGTGELGRVHCADPEAAMEAGDVLVAVAWLAKPIPQEDPDNVYTYAWAFDADADEANNLVAPPDLPGDFYQDTDRRYVLDYNPEGGWQLSAVDELATFPTAARVLVTGSIATLVVPLAEFSVSQPSMRLVAFRHGGDEGFAPPHDYDGSVWPAVEEGLAHYACESGGWCNVSL